MNIILLSGGSGKRLWPLSNEVRSKQFLKLFRQGEESISMLQLMYNGIKKVDPNVSIVIAAPQSQEATIKHQIGEEIPVSIEPCRRDTFAAIALATAFLHEKRNISENDTVVVCPVDPFVEQDYFECIKKLDEKAKASTANLVLMGINPTYPSEKYGYIIPDAAGKVKEFKEKPTVELAQKYIQQEALWNGGIFAYKVNYVLEKAKKLLETSDYKELFENYSNLEKISFDYAVVEHEPNIEVIKFDGKWMDLGTWNTLTESMPQKIYGNGIEERCENVNIINELSVPIFAMGIKNAVIAASPDGIIVTDKQQSAYIKPIVDQIVERPMYEERQWGTYRVIDHSENWLTKEIVIFPGKSLSYQKHKFRDEVWTITSGNGLLVLNGEIQKVERGAVITIKAGMLHTIKASDDTELRFIEVQLGEALIEEDIERFPYTW